MLALSQPEEGKLDHQSVSAKHLLIMLACCLIPLGLFGAVLFLKVDLGSFGLVAIMLLCPLLHIFMMRGIGHDHGQAKQGAQACHGEIADPTQGTPQQAEAAQPVVQKGA